MRTALLLPLLALLCGCIQKPVASIPRLEEAGVTRAVLAKHETDAVFTGVVDQPCRHLTTECPDKCDHGGRVARFTISKYRAYEKLGEYGDPQGTEFQAELRSRKGAPRLDTAILAKIEALKPGDKVRLDWRHEYVTRDGSSWPERVISRIEPITE